MFIGPIHHVSIITGNIEKSLALWKDILGWKVLADSESSGSELDVALGLNGVKKRAVTLCPPGNIYTGMLELVEFSSPKGKPARTDRKMNDVGDCVLAFRVGDCEKAYKELKKKGYKFFGPPVCEEVGGWSFKAAIFTDPVDNCKIEIIEFQGSPREFKR